MKIGILSFVCSAALILFLWADRTTLMAQQVMDPEQAAQAIVVQNLKVENNNVSGEVLNSSPHPVRDVELLIRHSWSWNNEFRPGKDDPGVALHHKVEGEIAPGASVGFNHRLSPSLPERTDGTFDTTVSVAGFTTVIPQ